MEKSQYTESFINRDLEVTANNRPRWNQPPFRRYSFHNFSQITRYSETYRAARVMALQPRSEPRIAALESVHYLTQHPYFSAMVVLQDDRILFESYAPDFRAHQQHSMQSITKTMTNLMLGMLVEAGKIDLSRKISDFLPEIGSGYSDATLQQVLNMDVQNDYSEDWSDENATVYRFEEMCRRVPLDASSEPTLRKFLCEIKANPPNTPLPSDTVRLADYKSTNTSVIAWIIERVSGVPLRLQIANIIDAAGIEGQFSISCDRLGVPLLSGGGAMTARDLARYGSLFARWGEGINGERVGSRRFLEATLKGGVAWSSNDQVLRYSNMTDTEGRVLAHGGYCGQYLMIDMESGIVSVYFSVTDSIDGTCPEHFEKIWHGLIEVGKTLPRS